MVKVTYALVRRADGLLQEIIDYKPETPPITLNEVIANMKEMAFIVETVAHLQGKEKELLPTAIKARELIATLEG